MVSAIGNEIEMKKIVLIAFFVSSAFAQDSHQWNLFSGNAATLLGAAAIAGVNDYSTAFYNPGNMGNLDENFSLTGNLFSAHEIRAYNGAGENNDVYTSLFDIIPNMTAGALPFQFDKKGRLGYVIFEKQFINNNYSYLKQQFVDLISEINLGSSANLFAGDEFYSGAFVFEKYITEYWAGLSWGRASGHWGLGFSLFTALRKQKSIFELYSVAADLQNSTAMTTDFKYMLDYFDVRVLLKTGISYNDETLRFGLTFTTASSHIYGKGNLGGNISSTGIFFHDDEGNVYGPHDFIATNKESALPTNYRSPFSLGFGIAKTLGETEIGFGCEYFGKLSIGNAITPSNSHFVIINPQNDDISANGKLIVLTTYQQSDAVFNYGFSVKQDFSEEISGYLNFRTDFSTTPKQSNELIFVNNEAWNIYHVTIGAMYKTPKITIGAGVQYSFSRDKGMTSFTNLNSTPLENNEMFLINNDPTDMRISYNRILISVGITYFIEPLL